MSATILIGEDEEAIRFGLRRFLEGQNFQGQNFAVDEESTCSGIEKALAARRYDVAILDNRLPDGRTLDLLPRVLETQPELPVILLTGHGSIDLAVQAVKLGVEQFLTKPVEMEALLVMIDRILRERRARRRERADRSGRRSEEPNPFVGESEAIRTLEEDARRAAPSELPLLLLGETGSGKGVLARWIHSTGPRREEPFVDVNCAGLRSDFLESELFGHEKGAFTGADSRKEGLFEVADRGTLFLDEIGDMSMGVQKKLLKVLEEQRFRRLGATSDRRVDVRILAATHQPLEELVGQGDFRRDLFYRMGSVRLRIPPLRDRRGDLPDLARALLREVGPAQGHSDPRLEPEAMQALRAHPWPGNIRELKNVLERALLFSPDGVIGSEHLDLFRDDASPDARAWDTSLSLAELEAEHVRRVLSEEDGAMSASARRLGIHRSTLYEKVKRYEIEVP